LGGEIDIEVVPGDVSTDEIISRVAKKEIDTTVADENIALINKGYHPNLSVSVAISFPQRIAWVVRNGDVDLLEKTNAWIRSFRGTRDYGLIYSKYYKNTRAFRKRRESEFFSYQGNKISPYDAILKEKAKEIEWDWRLLAARISAFPCSKLSNMASLSFLVTMSNFRLR